MTTVGMREVEIVKVDVSSGKIQKTADCVAEEKPLFVFLNKTHYMTIRCSPSNMKELAVGHLLSAGIVTSTAEIEEVELKEGACYVKLETGVNLKSRLKLSGSNSRVILSACGSSEPYQYSGKLPKVKTGLKVKAHVILNCVNRLNFVAETYRKTGGVHAAAVYEGDGTLVAFAEDVGRHNAVDKAIGSAALNKTDFSLCFLALSGRLTGDIVLKAARAGLPIVTSLAAALDSGIEIAQNTGVTLIGFVRGNRMNVYTSEERISL
jgi:FdhD protein